MKIQDFQKLTIQAFPKQPDLKNTLMFGFSGLAYESSKLLNILRVETHHHNKGQVVRLDDDWSDVVGNIMGYIVFIAAALGEPLPSQEELIKKSEWSPKEIPSNEIMAKLIKAGMNGITLMLEDYPLGESFSIQYLKSAYTWVVMLAGHKSLSLEAIMFANSEKMKAKFRESTLRSNTYIG